ncbi:MAG TPA: Holliday junction branch migration protein RuvA [Caldilineaceae bacterium]|nr:Holliday junction branch migration protein RuvA [Caldilineaceae bacterium]
MIRMVSGAVIAHGKDYLIVDVGGVGLKVFVPEPVAMEQSQGGPILLHTYLQVREDALNLYGFTDEEELAMFELLLGVSGVGPKVALATLGVLNPDALRLAIANEEPGLIARVPGVGKRTAEKIVLELRDKVKQVGGLQALATATEVDTEVIDALIALGYSVVEAQRAVQKVPKEATGVEERLRLALSQFS